MITRQFDLFLNKGVAITPTINVNQYDHNEQWVFTLYQENGSVYTPLNSAIAGVKSDKKGIINSASVNNDGQVVVVETEQMTAAAGIAIYELVIDNGTHGTANFIVQVEPKPTDGAELSDSDYSYIQDSIDYIAEAGASVGDIKTQIKANTNAIESERTARQNGDSALHSEIESVRSAVGSPLAASTAAEMTNTNKVYVYTGSETGYTAGDWYYYDGSAWVDGGVYNSVAFNTDKTLSVEGSAADAKKTGDAVDTIWQLLSRISDKSAVDFIGGNWNIANNKIIYGEPYVSITFACKKDRSYTVTREYGNRFAVFYTTSEPKPSQSCEEIVVDPKLNDYTFIPPAEAKYVIVTLQNDNAPGTSQTHEEIIASCAVYTYSAADYDAREESEQVSANYEQFIVDANNSDYWAIMGLGSKGENYTPRNWNISTAVYLNNIISVTTDDGYATRYVLYNSNKEFIYKSVFSREEINILSLMKEYSATYVRFEVQALDESGVEITTPIDDVSRYAHVHLYVLRDSGIKIAGASKPIEKWYENSIVQSTYLDRIKQAKYVYANTDSGISSHPVLTLLHFSDVHNNVDAMKYALDINKMFESDIDDMLHTGDVVKANLSDGISNWIDSGCANKVLNVIGNHDTEENLVLQAAGKDNVYNTFFAPYIAQWGATQPTGVDTPDSDNYHALYYYKDYSAAEVRLIVLDTNFWDTAQKSWLTSTLTDAKTNGLCVVIACHNVKLLTEMTDSNFSSYNGDGITETFNSYANQPADWLDPVDDFINDGGNFACILAGHNHDGHMGMMTNHPNIFVYVSDKASVSRVSGAARIGGEMNANAVSIVVINPVEKLFKIVKIGAQIDGKMRPQNVFCYDYANKKIVSQW